MNESISGESHLVSYVSVKPGANSQQMVVGVPFIGSKRTLEKQLETDFVYFKYFHSAIRRTSTGIFLCFEAIDQSHPYGHKSPSKNESW